MLSRDGKWQEVRAGSPLSPPICIWDPDRPNVFFSKQLVLLRQDMVYINGTAAAKNENLLVNDLVNDRKKAWRLNNDGLLALPLINQRRTKLLTDDRTIVECFVGPSGHFLGRAAPLNDPKSYDSTPQNYLEPLVLFMFSGEDLWRGTRPVVTETYLKCCFSVHY